MQPPKSSPRVLDVDLGALRAGATPLPRPWSARRAWLEALGRWSGGALGLAWLAERALDDPRASAPLVISVGACVARGMPTAARASVASRAPLTGLFAEGLVGGSFARRLASVADMLAVHGQILERGAVLVVERQRVALEVWPELAGLAPQATHARLAERFGDCASLAIGPAGERGLATASLSSSGTPPHIVGRGGLGAVLGRCGLKALVVRAPEVESAESGDLARELARSPRLLARSEGGTFEQLEAFRARGELFERSGERAVEAATVERLAQQVHAARGARHGCGGCPTPCGWSFDTRAGARQGARFGASYALGLQLGLEQFDDALELLRMCDEFGVDAKEIGACLALLARAAEGGAGGPRFGERATFQRCLRELVDGSGPGASMAHGALPLARALGLELASAKGASLRPDASLASLLGQCVSSRGGDPMRTFPFLAVDGSDWALMRASTGLDFAPEASDPASPVGKGRLVAWHEDWANALDVLGFCSFSAASLVCDGILDVPRLERALAPPSWSDDGVGMLRAGALLSMLQRRLNELWGIAADADRPGWARPRLDLAGMWDEYAAARGLEADGRLSAASLRALEALSPNVAPEPERRAVAPAVPSPSAPGRVELRHGAGATLVLELELPCTARELLERLRDRGLGAQPALFRAGRRVASSDWVHDGDRIELVSVIAGG
ncbi:MAG: hypothetical protein IT454_09170 [Planctomycetes bacterium]|nr:hypothetical protein [Planctomycetota bacterium]